MVKIADINKQKWSKRSGLSWLWFGCLLLWLCGCTPQASKLELKGSDVTEATLGGEFTLMGHDGQPRSLSQFQGKVVALFFGYTHCPDVCPTTMLEYAAAVKKLGTAADNVQVIFVSVDPERDTPAVLAGYVPYFNPHFLGLTGTPAQIEQIKKQYKIVAQKVSRSAGGYTVDHSAGSYLLDQTGRVRVFEAYGTSSDNLLHDIGQLLR